MDSGKNIVAHTGGRRVLGDRTGLSERALPVMTVSRLGDSGSERRRAAVKR